MAVALSAFATEALGPDFRRTPEQMTGYSDDQADVFSVDHDGGVAAGSFGAVHGGISRLQQCVVAVAARSGDGTDARPDRKGGPVDVDWSAHLGQELAGDGGAGGCSVDVGQHHDQLGSWARNNSIFFLIGQERAGTVTKPLHKPNELVPGGEW
ncbi:MAG: hypothetical protein S0880_33000 [Actinomycetota bacterium]|nr:hypothetical protein [Actinomycetota bacterium]